MLGKVGVVLVFLFFSVELLLVSGLSLQTAIALR